LDFFNFSRERREIKETTHYVTLRETYSVKIKYIIKLNQRFVRTFCHRCITVAANKMQHDPCCISHFLSSASHVYSDESQSATSNLTSLTNLSEDRRKLPYSTLWDVNSRRFSVPCIAWHSSKQTDSLRDRDRVESS